MKNKFLKISLVLLVICTLLTCEYSYSILNLASFANELVYAKTNNQNIRFATYFNNNEVSQKVDINSSEIPLYINLEVIQDGYFNGKIRLENSNFEFVRSNTSYVSKVSRNEIELNKINNNEKVVIEVMVKPVLNEKLDLANLSCSSNLILEGIYKNSSKKDIEISATSKLELTYVSNSPKAIVNQEIITNKVEMYNTTLKKIVQVKYQLGLENNSYPIKNIKLELDNFEDKQKDVVYNFNGLNMTDISNVSENSKDIYYFENKGINNYKTGADELVVSYILDKDEDLTNSILNYTSKIELYDGTILEASGNSTYDNTVKDNIISASESNKNVVYDSLKNVGRNTDIETTLNVNININNVAQILRVENINDETITTKQIKILNQDIKKYFGNEANLEISTVESDGTKKYNFTGSSDQDIVIDTNCSKFELVSTKPIASGNVEIYLQKEMTDKVNTKNASTTNIYYETAQSSEGVNNTSKYEVQLQPSYTKTQLEINKSALSTIANNENVEFKVILNTSSRENALYNNPIIKIELPSQIENININSVDKIYADDFEIKKYFVEGNSIVVELEGTSQNYSNIDGTMIAINTNLELNNDSTSVTQSVKSSVLNNIPSQNNRDEQLKEIKIVSPKGMITFLKVDNNQTFGVEDNIVENLEINSDTKEVLVNAKIINNDINAKDISIIGNVGKDENSKIQLSSPIVVNTNKEYKVYYSEDDETDNFNEQYSPNAKRYLIKISDLANAEKVELSYTLSVEKNLEYNVSSNINYEVQYDNEKSENTQTSQSSIVTLTTGTGPQVEANILAKVGSKIISNNEKVKKGQVITYQTTLKNTGNVTSENINVETVVSDNMELIGEAQKEISLASGEEKQISVLAKVKEDANQDETVTSKTVFTYSNLEKETQTLSNTVVDSKLSVILRYVEPTMEVEEGVEESKDEIQAGTQLFYVVDIKNISNEDIENAKLTWNIPDEAQLCFVKEYDEHSELVEVDETNANDIIIKKLEAGQTVSVVAVIKAKEDLQEDKTLIITANVEINKGLLGKEQISSNEQEIPVKSISKFEISLNSNSENEYLKAGDEINYVLEVKNNNSLPYIMKIEDVLPSQLTLKSTSLENITNSSLEEVLQEGEQVNANQVIGFIELQPSEKKQITISAVVNNKEVEDDLVETIENVVTCSTETITLESNKVSHNIQIVSNDTKTEDTSDDTTVKPSGNTSNGTSSTQGVANQEQKNIISGKVWIDTNKDGLIDSNENGIESVEIMLLNLDKATVEQKTSTDNSGNYKFENFENGTYIVVFNYDNGIYAITTYNNSNSNAKSSKAIGKEITIDGETKYYGITEQYDVNSSKIANINLGLYENAKFDLKLDKYISQISVNNSKGQKIYTYDNDCQLAKVELDQKLVNETNIAIKYTIKITNQGEVAGYATSIVDYIPQDMTFQSELNKDWYKEQEYIYNKSLANQKINPGETKVVELVLTKKMTNNNIGRISNSAELSDATNELGAKDINSTPGNKNQKENDYSTADAIISIRTGATEISIISLVIITIVATGCYVIYNNRKLKEIKIKNYNIKGGK